MPGQKRKDKITQENYETLERKKYLNESIEYIKN